MSRNRRSFTPALKAQVVLEVMSGVRSAAEVCREYKIKPQLFNQWKNHLLKNASGLFDGTTRRSEEQARIEELERVLGQKTLEKAIDELAAAWPTYGYRRITAMLQRQNWCVNRKRVLRLLREMGLLRAPKPKKQRTTNSKHSYPRHANLVANLTVVRPDHVWVADITYIRLHHEFVYLAVILDVFTRTIRGWHLGRSLDLGLTLSALRPALSKNPPEIHHSDQGIQYSAPAYTEILLTAGVKISMAEVGEPSLASTVVG